MAECVWIVARPDLLHTAPVRLGGPPTAGLVEGTDGNLYGTTDGYAGKQNGMIFKITPSGTFTTLHAGGAFATG